MTDLDEAKYYVRVGAITTANTSIDLRRYPESEHGPAIWRLDAQPRPGGHRTFYIECDPAITDTTAAIAWANTILADIGLPATTWTPADDTDDAYPYLTAYTEQGHRNA